LARLTLVALDRAEVLTFRVFAALRAVADDVFRAPALAALDFAAFRFPVRGGLTGSFRAFLALGVFALAALRPVLRPAFAARLAPAPVRAAARAPVRFFEGVSFRPLLFPLFLAISAPDPDAGFHPVPSVTAQAHRLPAPARVPCPGAG
jgi:hypothetical protein